MSEPTGGTDRHRTDRDRADRDRADRNRADRDRADRDRTARDRPDRGGPPRLARLLLARLVPAGERPRVLADLAELFRIRQRDRGRLRAALWYWRQVFSFPLHLARERLRSSPGNPADLRSSPGNPADLRSSPGNPADLRSSPGDPAGLRFSTGGSPGSRSAPQGKAATVLHEILRDARFGVRNMAAAPGFTILAVLVLALGIGALVPTFSMVNAYFLRPLPFAEPERLVHIWETREDRGFDRSRAAWPNVRDWKEADSFEDIAVFNYTGENLTGGDRTERVSAARVSANLFDVLGVEPVLGRGFRPGEDLPGNTDVVVLDHDFWQTRFEADPEVLGRTLEINGRVHDIVGVMPPEFVFPLVTTRFWVPRELDAEHSPRDRSYLQVVGRLRPGVTAEEAQAELDGISRALADAYPETNADVGANVTDLRAALNFAHDILRTISGIVFAAGGLVLLIACANVSSLLLARGLSRGREVAIRSAIGASRGQIVRQLLVESFLLAAGGGALGLVLAALQVNLAASVLPDDLYRIGAIEIDAAAVGVALGLTFVTALLFGLVPALRLSDVSLSTTLREGGHGVTGSRNLRLQKGLVVAQVGLALVLLVGTALVLRSLQALQETDTGFEADRVLSMQVSLPSERYDRDATLAFYRSVLDEVGAVPGVERAAMMNMLPLNHEYSEPPVEVPGFAAEGERAPTAIRIDVSSGFFQTLGIRVRQGRGFDRRDGVGAAPVAVVSRTFVDRYFSGVSPLGRTFRVGGDDDSYRIVGVVDDMAFVDLSGAGQPQFYRPLAQEPQRYFRVLARTGGPPLDSVGPVREAVRRVDPDLPILEVWSLADTVSQFMLPEQSMSAALAGLSLGALLLACVGIYGVVAFFVSLRSRDMSIRMALGASRRRVLGHVLAGGLRLTLAGLVLGLLGAFAVTRVLAGFLVGVSSLDPVVFLVAPLGLVVVTTLACWVPARRVTRLDPMVAMRSE